MPSITDLFAETKVIQKLISRFGEKENQLLTGISHSAKTLLAASILKKKKNKVVWITQNTYHANQLASDLTNLVDSSLIHVFETNDVLHAEMSTASPQAQAERIQSLEFLTSTGTGIVIIPLAGVRKILPDVNTFKTGHLSLEMDQEIEVDHIISKLVDMGYRRDQRVAKPGEFSVRGGIIDIYPLTEEHPLRIELFDIVVDSMRLFDVESQRSIENIQRIEILPAQDILLTQENREQALERFDQDFNAMYEQVDEEGQHLLAQELNEVREAIEKKHHSDDLVRFANYLYPHPASVIDYIPEDAQVIVDEYPHILENNAQLDHEEAEWLISQQEKGKVFNGQKVSLDFKEELKKFHGDRLHLSLFEKGMGSLKFNQKYNLKYRTMQQFFGQMPLLKTEMERFAKQDYTVVIMAESKERLAKIHQTLKDFEIESTIQANQEIIRGETIIVPFSLANGFELTGSKIAIITEKELFNKVQRRKSRPTKLSNAERLKNYNELSPGDYVVHVDHGIGKFEGMETMEIKGVHQDYLSISYQGTGKLFIPVTQLNLLQKYVSSEGKEPKINKLGGTSWAKTKKKVATQIEDIADDLINLYAEREQKKGYAYPKDTQYQKEFEDAFVYSETPDQLRSTEEIKKDLEKAKPMDRLLVGDVGYGKTEVAIRAIFKVVQEGKQVAFLVPTTVLAQQHYTTMVDRFQDFPVEVGLLSRFRTKKQQDQTKEELRKGQLDIVVGTHRVLSKDIEFQDLGLLIIDEEQRFGVKHKERLKQLKNQVDVLTLTATPIPRTLHMSMLGVRDLSVIETPPSNRYPVQTYVMEMNGIVIREAIEREMSRGGQVFFLHNRVDTIESRVDELRQLVPDARIVYAHGRMTETQLENILFEFMEGDYDVLVTTTIIETGVDMPNVNTLLVEDADRMGLSQLYQLRGRVGRGGRIAYAYFMYQRDKVLTEVSEKRLQAVKDFTELGSGFKIAMRDLSIRGAGNLLGQQQHGFIDSVGFDLYSQMLQEAVKRKMGTEEELRTNLEIDLGIDAYLPTAYINDERQKIELYKRIRQFESEEDYIELQDEMIDRFGEYPSQVSDLMTVGLIKMYGEQALVETIKVEKNDVLISFSKEGTSALEMPEIFKALKDVPLKTDFDVREGLTIRLIKANKVASSVLLDSILTFVKEAQAIIKSKNLVKGKNASQDLSENAEGTEAKDNE